MIPISAGQWPKHMQSRALAGGQVGYYWSPHVRILRGGAPFERRALGTDLAAAIAKATELTSALEYWLAFGRLPGEGPDHPIIIPGSIDDVFQTYREHAPSQRKSYATLPEKTKRDYDRGLNRFASYRLKDGRRLGEALAIDLTPATVDAVYEKLLTDPETGEVRRRSSNLMIAACRRAWNIAHRAKPSRVPKDNPFERMSLDTSAVETIPATYAQLETFEAKAAEMGYPEIAFAARCAWELLQRPTEICRDFAWGHWRPADRPEHVLVLHHKTGEQTWLPISDDGVDFYPELVARLSAIPKRGALVFLEERRKGPRPKKPAADAPTPVYGPYSLDTFRKRAAKVREAAELPSHVTFASFRHGGLTELGDAGLADSLAQALSRHKKRETLTRYIHRTDRQQREGIKLRVAHRRSLQSEE